MTRRSSPVSRREGFTVVELLVVLALIALFMTVFLPSIPHARQAARQVACKDNLKQVALRMHTRDSAELRLLHAMIDYHVARSIPATLALADAAEGLDPDEAREIYVEAFASLMFSIDEPGRSVYRTECSRGVL